MPNEETSLLFLHSRKVHLLFDYREEGEKFNVWQARLNMEMQYGDPPEEAVMKLFQRALSYTNQKKLYMVLIGILQQANKVAQVFTSF